MSITDELRECIATAIWQYENDVKTAYIPKDKLLAIADRIDAEHEKAVTAAHSNGITKYGSMVAREYVKLPVDADGKVIHVEDEVELLDGSNRFKAEWLEWDGEDWAVHETIGYGAYHEPSSLRHSHKPTVEDVLREFAERICSGDHAVINGTYRGLEDLDLLAEYAAKLQLAGEDA